MGRKPVKVWWKELPAYIKAVAGVISAIGVIVGCVYSVSNALVCSLDNKINEQIQPIASKIDNIELDTQRIQLLQLLQSETATIQSVLGVAESYFCDLHGDSYVLYEFEEWAARNNVDVKFVLKCHNTVAE